MHVNISIYEVHKIDFTSKYIMYVCKRKLRETSATFYGFAVNFSKTSNQEYKIKLNKSNTVRNGRCSKFKQE